MENLPIPAVVRLPDGTYTYTYADPSALPAQRSEHAAPIIHQHIHQAPPDRTVQRIALGSGVGAGTVAAGVYFGPLLVGVLTAIAANLAMLAFIALILGWATVTVVRSVTGTTKPSRKGR